MAKRKLTHRQMQHIRARRERLRERATEGAAGDAAQVLERAGTVVARFGAELAVEDPEGEVIHCRLRRNVGKPVCGDRVVWQSTGPAEGIVVALQTRDSMLLRTDAAGRSKPIAANVDRVVVVGAVAPPLSELELDRYLVVAAHLDIPALIVINKVDLLDDAARSELEMRLNVYRGIGYCLLFTSTRHAHGVDALARELRGHTGVLLGPSGVGKSSLIKTLVPGREVRIGALSEASGRGRQTTTTAMLYHLPDGGDLIDAPGVSAFSLAGYDAATIAAGFVEFRPQLGQCRFSDCRHFDEPGCAVAAAVQRGEVTRERLERYRALVESAVKGP